MLTKGGVFFMKRILIVEDDEAIRTELSALLRANGYLPVEDVPCDLILMDVNLPGESGIELVHGDASALEGRPADADIFLANINRNIITADIDRYAAVIRPGGRLTVSGFYVEDRPVVEEAARRAGLTLQSVADQDNWSSMTFSKS